MEFYGVLWEIVMVRLRKQIGRALMWTFRFYSNNNFDNFIKVAFLWL